MFTSCYTHRRLFIDLISRSFLFTEIATKEFRLYVGGRGLNAFYAYNSKLHLVDPFSPENTLLIAPGALVGMPCLYANRTTLTAKSPLTGLLGDSNVGGDFGVFMKWAEIDQLVIEHNSNSPVVLVISKTGCEFLPAENLWGKDTDETERILRETFSNKKYKSLLVIGPAGENKVRFASVHSSSHAAGRTGIGAVMGNKRVKAIVVLGSLPRYKLNESAKWYMKRLCKSVSDDPAFCNAQKYGATTAIEGFNKLGVLEVKNLTHGTWNYVDEISGKSLRDNYTIRHYGCLYCNIRCKGISRFEGANGVYDVHGPEFAGLQNYGARILNHDLPSVCLMTKISNQKGLDFMSMAAILSWLMECLEHQYISYRKLDNIELGWGKVPEAIEIINKTALREGIGDILAEGGARASAFLGNSTKRCLLTIKNMEFEGCDPRGYKGRGVGYGVASRGADNCRTLSAFEGLLTPSEAKYLYGYEEAGNLTGVKGKGKLLKFIEDYTNVGDLLGLCRYAMYVFASSRDAIMERNNIIGEYFPLISGLEDYKNYDDLIEASERTINLERLMVQENGFSKKDDLLPERFRKEPIPDGPAKGGVVENEIILEEYYKARGWSSDGKVEDSIVKYLRGENL